MSSGTTGMTETTAKDMRDALEGVLAPRLAALVGERGAGHCMRITEVGAELAAVLVRRLRGRSALTPRSACFCPKPNSPRTGRSTTSASPAPNWSNSATRRRARASCPDHSWSSSRPVPR